MGKTTQSANDFLNYALRNVAPSWGAGGNLYLSLHTAAVNVGDDQTTNEAAYSGYGRIALTRSAGGSFNAAANRSAANNALIQFGNSSTGPETITHVAIGENSAGAGTVLWVGALASPLVVNVNIQPQFAIGQLVVTEA